MRVCIYVRLCWWGVGGHTAITADRAGDPEQREPGTVNGHPGRHGRNIRFCVFSLHIRLERLANM